MKLPMLLGIVCCLVVATCGQGFGPNRGVTDLPFASQKYRRQLNTQQHILTDVQQHQTQQGQFKQQQQQQPYFLQQTASIEVPLPRQQQQQQQLLLQHQQQQKYRQQLLPIPPTTINTRREPPSGSGHSNFIQQGHSNNNNINNNNINNNNNNNNNYPHNNQFQRSAQSQLYTPQFQQQHYQQPQPQQPQQQQQLRPQPELDQHTQNFLALRNFGVSQTSSGPQQSLPPRSYNNNKPFQSQQQSQAPIQPTQQYQPLPAAGFQRQAFRGTAEDLPTEQQKLLLPTLLPVPTFQTLTQQQQQQHHVQPTLQQQLQPTQQQPQAEKPFSPAPQFLLSHLQQQPQQQRQHQQQQQQQFQPTQQQRQSDSHQQQQQQYSLTPNLGLPVPQFFSNSQPQNEFVQQQQQQPQQHQQQFGSPPPSQQSAFNIPQPSPTPDQEYKQKLIQKHEQFVQKQYEKSQHKVRQQHEEFQAKQHQLKQQLVVPTLQHQQQQQPEQQQQPQQQYLQHTRSRPVLDSSDLLHFSSALKKYHLDHPTTTTTTTTTSTTTTEAPTRATTSKPSYPQIRSDLGKYGTKTHPKRPVKTIARDELLKQLKAALAETPQQPLEGNKTYDEMDLVLPNGQHVQVIRTTDPNLVKGQKSFSQDQLQELLSQQSPEPKREGSSNSNSKLSIDDVAPSSAKDLVLPSGAKVQIQRSGATQASETSEVQHLPPGVDLSNLASLYGGGAEFSGISSGANSIASSAVIASDSDEPPSLEELANRGLIPDGYEIDGLSSASTRKPKPKPAAAPPPAPPRKKATYVYLEEQTDGSFKIQGVKANGEKETRQTGAEVESILERIRSGEIKLPPSVQRLTLPNDEVVEIESGNIIKTTRAPPTTPRWTTTTPRWTTTTPHWTATTPRWTTTTPPPTTTSTTTTTTTTTTTPPPPPPPPPSPSNPRNTATTRHNQPPHSSDYPYVIPTMPAYEDHSSTLHQPQTGPAASPYHTPSTPIYYATVAPSINSYGPSTHVPLISDRLSLNEAASSAADIGTAGAIDHSAPLPHADTLVQETENNEKKTDAYSVNPSEDLIQILKTNGLFAMAKYLRQSGLDSILNETGPYTLFVPTDKAFKNLLVQLGGPERAEEKFKANPRLLSGLLLHHVIPGAFEIATLQDEMTGVSLAGTQLRVNQYTMHDQEWNDVTLTTINGAMVVLNKKDIKIPQGVAHAVDRVMFPLPVGDLLQTLQSDRENRFSNFLKVLYTSGLSEKLQTKGIKTYTVFAPIDKSFNDIESDALDKLFNDKEAAEEFAMKHIVTGSLFSAGMRFYQVKDSLQTGRTVILQKTSAGKIKVNDAQMVTSNIPATNGVIHAIDGVIA